MKEEIWTTLTPYYDIWDITHRPPHSKHKHTTYMYMGAMMGIQSPQRDGQIQRHSNIICI